LGNIADGTEAKAAAEARGLGSEIVDLGVSMLRFSWALTVFGAQQAANMVTTSPTAQAHAAANAFDAVANAVEEQFGGVFRGAYKAGRDYMPGIGHERSEAAASKG
jgi:hypothetical protein